jgi:hypothetical protein
LTLNQFAFPRLDELGLDAPEASLAYTESPTSWLILRKAA